MARTLAKQFAAEFEDECAPFQYALSTRAGTDCVGHMLCAADLDSQATMLSVDGIGAYDHVLWVNYKFIKTTFIKKFFSSKSTFIKNHFHQNATFIKIPLSSKYHFHQKPLSSKSTFIKNHFHQKPFSSKTNFIRDHFHQKPFSSKTNFIKNQFHQSTSC